MSVEVTRPMEDPVTVAEFEQAVLEETELDAATELKMVRKAIAGGTRVENRVTDLVFRARHKWPTTRRIKANEKELAREWLVIRNDLVRPALRCKSIGDFVYHRAPGIVPPETQPSSLSCWATVGTMMLEWRDRMSYTIEEAMRLAGPKYLKLFKDGNGLLAADHVDYANALGMAVEPPMSYSVEGFARLLRERGALIAIADEAPGTPWAVHARVVTGIVGCGAPDNTFLRLNDPAVGREVVERFDTFQRKFEEVAGSPRAQIMYFR
jgi:hypothetical protein